MIRRPQDEDTVPNAKNKVCTLGSVLATRLRDRTTNEQARPSAEKANPLPENTTPQIGTSELGETGESENRTRELELRALE